MDRRSVKFWALGGGVLATMGFLLAVGMREPGGFAYYVTVSEFLTHPPASAHFRVAGKVESGSIVRQDSGLDVSFRMTDGEHALPVRYHGIVQDTFVDGAEVVVEGSMGGDGVFLAHKLLAKCPSKYEASKGATPKT